MRRRYFVKLTGVALISPYLLACSNTTHSTTSDSPTKNNAQTPNDSNIQTLRDGGAAASILIGLEEPLAGLLVLFATQIGAAAISSLSDMLTSSDQTQSSNVAQVNSNLAANNFNQGAATQVYNTGNVFFYGLPYEDRINCCGPIFMDGNNVAYVGGPVLYALYLSSIPQLWTPRHPVSTRDALLPVCAQDNSFNLDDYTASSFQQPALRKFQTPTGRLTVDYQPKMAGVSNGSGTVTLTAIHDSLGPLLQRGYDFNYKMG